MYPCSSLVILIVVWTNNDPSTGTRNGSSAMYFSQRSDYKVFHLWKILDSR